MTVHRLEMSQAVRNLITHLSPELKRKVRATFRAIAADPYQAKELKDELAGLRSHRLGSARIIFRLTGQVVEVIAFGPRCGIYERVAAELSTLLRRKRGSSRNRGGCGSSEGSAGTGSAQQLMTRAQSTAPLHWMTPALILPLSMIGAGRSSELSVMLVLYFPTF